LQSHDPRSRRHAPPKRRRAQAARAKSVASLADEHGGARKGRDGGGSGSWLPMIPGETRAKGYQVIMSTHDTAEAEFLVRKCQSAGIPHSVHELVPPGDNGLVQRQPEVDSLSRVQGLSSLRPVRSLSVERSRRTAAIAASFSLQRVPAKVFLLNPQPPLSLDGGNRCSCPYSRPSRQRNRAPALGGYLPLAPGVSTVCYPIPQRTIPPVRQTKRFPRSDGFAALILFARSSSQRASSIPPGGRASGLCSFSRHEPFRNLTVYSPYVRSKSSMSSERCLTLVPDFSFRSAPLKNTLFRRRFGRCKYVKP
jgi:hypothetical protein